MPIFSCHQVKPGVDLTLKRIASVPCFQRLLSQMHDVITGSRTLFLEIDCFHNAPQSTFSLDAEQAAEWSLSLRAKLKA